MPPGRHGVVPSFERKHALAYSNTAGIMRPRCFWLSCSTSVFSGKLGAASDGLTTTINVRDAGLAAIPCNPMQLLCCARA